MQRMRLLQRQAGDADKRKEEEGEEITAEPTRKQLLASLATDAELR